MAKFKAYSIIVALFWDLYALVYCSMIHARAQQSVGGSSSSVAHRLLALAHAWSKGGEVIPLYLSGLEPQREK